MRKAEGAADGFAPHYFIHLTYQEYFAALYIAQQLSMQPFETEPDKELERRKTIQNLALKIQKTETNRVMPWFGPF